MTIVRFLFLYLLIIHPLVSTAQAQLDDVIEKPGASDITLDFSGIDGRNPQAATFFRSLKRNLILHSLLREVPPSQAGFQVGGTAVSQGAKIEVSVRVRNRSLNRDVFGKKYRVNPDQMEILARKVSDEVVKSLTGLEGFSQKRIAFIGLRNGEKGKEIYSAFPDGSGMVRLTRDQSVKLGLEWTPDGASLIYTSYHRGFPDIYRHTLRDGKRVALSASSGINAGGAVSPNGQKMAMILSKDGKPELYVKDLRSGRLTRLTQTPMSAKSSPSWSPDGRSIVFTSSHQGQPHLYVVRDTGGAPRRLTRGGGENLSPDWGKNGLIVFTRRRAGKYQISVLDPKKGRVTYISPMDADYEDPSWAPDGLHVVASRTIRGASSLYLLDSAGKEAKALLQGQGNWYMPAWSR